MMKVLGVFLILITVGVLGVGGLFAGLNNKFVALEASIKAQYEQNKNNYSNYFNKLKEAAQVPKMYAGDLEKVYTAAIQGRYGTAGAKAVFSMIKEQNPDLSPAMYTKLQNIIESGRASFESDQKLLLDKKRVYEEELKIFPNVLIANFLGFPKINLEEYSIVTNEATEQAFATKKAGPIQL